LKMARIKVILSYPQVVFREGIHFSLSGEEGFEVVGETTGNREAYELIEVSLPNIVILSQQDAEISGDAVTRRIKRIYPLVSVILITADASTEPTFAALRSGASAVFTPDIGPENLMAVIKEVAGGRLPVVATLLDPAMAARALADFQDLVTLSERLGISLAALTKREAEVLDNIASGGGHGQAVADLNLAEEAVRDMLRIVLSKLVANDRARAVIEEVQKTWPVFVYGAFKSGGEPPDYLTRAEFERFKDNLAARFRSLVAEKT
jgi:DNA-binding NarL/FixJ family response regulator